MQANSPPKWCPDSRNDLDIEIERLYATLPEDQARIAIDRLVREDPRETKYDEGNES